MRENRFVCERQRESIVLHERTGCDALERALFETVTASDGAAAVQSAAFAAIKLTD